jgi:uncharacterized protein YxeA
MNTILRKLIASLVFVLCLVWYAKTHFYRDPGSAFFDVQRAYERKYSQHRQSQVTQYIDGQISTGDVDNHGKAGGNASLCLTLSSVVRKKTQYLEVCNSLQHFACHGLI